MKLIDAKQEAKTLGFILTKKDGEYRLCPIGGTEDQAYYTDDLADAIGTARMLDVWKTM